MQSKKSEYVNTHAFSGFSLAGLVGGKVRYCLVREGRQGKPGTVSKGVQQKRVWVQILFLFSLLSRFALASCLLSASLFFS